MNLFNSAKQAVSKNFAKVVSEVNKQVNRFSDGKSTALTPQRFEISGRQIQEEELLSEGASCTVRFIFTIRWLRIHLKGERHGHRRELRPEADDLPGTAERSARPA